ncbi:unnamed protein product [Closterium sp. NIES-53]
MATLRVLPFDLEGRPVAFDLGTTICNSPPATADVSFRSQWLSRDAIARLAIRNHLPATECAHFGEHTTAQTLYDAVVARYSSPATAALGRLLLPNLFPELSAFATVADLVTHLRTSDARYRATVPAEFLPTNQPPMFITLYFIVTRLHDSLRSVRDHFLTLDPTSLTVDLHEQHLLAAETSAVATSLFLRTSVLLRLVRSAATARARVAGVVEEAALVAELAEGVVVGAAVEEAEAVEVVAAVGPVAKVEALVAAVEAAEGVAAVEAVGPVVGGLDLSVEALVVVGASKSSVGARLRHPSSSHRCFARLDDAWRTEFGDGVERPRWAELLRSGVAIFDLDFDVIISAMYALSFSAEGDYYWCVPPDPGTAAAALGASASGTPPSTAPTEALHTFTLDSGASRCFIRDSTTLTPLPAPVLARLADPSGGPVVSSSSTVLPWSSLYTLATEPPQVAASAQVSASGQVAASCSCRLLSNQTLLWHHHLGNPSMPRLRGMHSRLLVSGLPRSLPPLLPSPAPPCLPCVEGRQRATPHSSFPPTTAPLQNLHIDVSAQSVSSCRVVRQGSSCPEIAERHIGLVMEVARTSMIHAAAPHFLWPFAVRYAAHQFNLWPRVSLPKTSPTLRWTGKVGDASVFRRRVLPSQDVMFDESVPFYRLFPYRSAPSPPLSLFLAPGPPPLDPLPRQGPTPSGVSQVDPLLGTAPVQVAVVSGAAPGAASGGAASGGVELEGAGSEGAGRRVRSLGVLSLGVLLRLEVLLVLHRDCPHRRPHRRSGPHGAGESGDTGAGGAAVTTGAGDPTEPGAAGARGAGAGVAGVGGPGAGGARAAGAGAVDPGAGAAGGTVQPWPYFVP